MHLLPTRAGKTMSYTQLGNRLQVKCDCCFERQKQQSTRTSPQCGPGKSLHFSFFCNFRRGKKRYILMWNTQVRLYILLVDSNRLVLGTIIFKICPLLTNFINEAMFVLFLQVLGYFIKYSAEEKKDLHQFLCFQRE